MKDLKDSREDSIDGMKKLKNLKKEDVAEDNGLWAEGSFTETMSSYDWEAKMRTFHMKHDEEMNYFCKQCSQVISAHNKDWHNGMCDDCFNKAYYPNDQAAYEKRIEKKDGKITDYYSKEHK